MLISVYSWTSDGAALERGADSVDNWKLLELQLGDETTCQLRLQSPVPSSKFQVPSPKFQVPSSKFQVQNSKFQVPSPCRSITCFVLIYVGKFSEFFITSTIDVSSRLISAIFLNRYRKLQLTSLSLCVCVCVSN